MFFLLWRILWTKRTFDHCNWFLCHMKSWTWPRSYRPPAPPLVLAVKTEVCWRRPLSRNRWMRRKNYPRMLSNWNSARRILAVYVSGKLLTITIPKLRNLKPKTCLLPTTSFAESSKTLFKKHLTKQTELQDKCTKSASRRNVTRGRWDPNTLMPYVSFFWKNSRRNQTAMNMMNTFVKRSLQSSTLTSSWWECFSDNTTASCEILDQLIIYHFRWGRVYSGVCPRACRWSETQIGQNP